MLVSLSELVLKKKPLRLKYNSWLQFPALLRKNLFFILSFVQIKENYPQRL